jgi:hypothetical protein
VCAYSQLGLHAFLSHVEAQHREFGGYFINAGAEGVHFYFPFDFFVLVTWPLFSRICFSRTPGIGDMLVCALFVG